MTQHMPTANTSTQTQAKPDVDRREYFRVQELLLLRIETLASPEAPAQTPDELQHVHDLLRELHTVDAESQPLLRTVTEKASELGNYLRLHNRKMELVLRYLTDERIRSYYREKVVSLSAKGLGCSVDHALPIGSVFDLHLLLLPASVHVHARAKVIHCESPGKLLTAHYIGAEFVQITETDRDALIRHALRVQAQQRRDEREQG